MSTAYNEFRKKAVEILAKDTDNETISRVAFHLMQSELENEKKQSELEKENEKKIMKITMELEKSALEKENEKKIMIMEMEKSELEKENEKKILIIEMERKQEKMEMEMETKLERQQMKQNQSNAFHAKQISAVVQRLVVLYVCTHHESVRFSVFSPLTPADHRFFSSSVCVFCILTDKSSRAF